MVDAIGSGCLGNGRRPCASSMRKVGAITYLCMPRRVSVIAWLAPLNNWRSDPCPAAQCSRRSSDPAGSPMVLHSQCDPPGHVEAMLPTTSTSANGIYQADS